MLLIGVVVVVVLPMMSVQLGALASFVPVLLAAGAGSRARCRMRAERLGATTFSRAALVARGLIVVGDIASHRAEPMTSCSAGRLLRAACIWTVWTLLSLDPPMILEAERVGG
jgi:hypothetical protein